MRGSWLIRTGFAAAVVWTAVAAVDVEMDPQPRWWRGNLHTHTLWSDGDDFPEMVAEWYRNQGYHFLALSDHDLLSAGERWMTAAAINRRAGVDAVGKYRKRFGDQWVERRGEEIRLKPFDEYRALVEERNRFLMIQAEEIAGTAGDGRTLHMNVSNLGEMLTFQSGATVRESITRNLQMVQESAKRTGREVLLHVNHPNYKWGVTAEDLAAVVGERFFEVWNGVDGDNDPGDGVRPGTDEMWDIANTLRIVKYKAPPLYGLATDDTHGYHGNKPNYAPGRGWVMVKARHLTAASIVRAIRAGEFYSSSGVELEDVTYADRKLALRIRETAGESYVTRFLGTRKGVRITGKPRSDSPEEATLQYGADGGPRMGEVLAEVKGLTPSYTLRGDELYVRAVVTSTGKAAGESEEFPYKRAWTQPVGW
jgi:hypothetical protein